MSPYYSKIMEKLLVDGEENTVCSPLNTYIAFAMMAEITGGNSRQQILDMLNVADIEILREQVHPLWLSNYVNTPIVQSLLANSFWMNDEVTYHQETLDILSEEYFASSFSGKMGLDEMNEAIRKWMDDNTDGLLGEYTKEISLDIDTVLAIVSTIYYKASWVEDFLPEQTTQETFHGTQGDEQVDMMHKSDEMGVYKTRQFFSGRTRSG